MLDALPLGGQELNEVGTAVRQVGAVELPQVGRRCRDLCRVLAHGSSFVSTAHGVSAAGC